MKSRGDNVHPCLIPTCCCFVEDIDLLILTLYLRFEYVDVMYFVIKSLSSTWSFCLSVESSLSCGIESKALERSTKKVATPAVGPRVI